MTRRRWNERANRFVRPLLTTLAVQVGWPASAQAQVDHCQPSEFLDRTAPGADREIFWDVSITGDPQKCMLVQVGQTVVWNANPDFDVHPLVGREIPSPITLHQNGSVTFDTPGTFNYICTQHTSMKGAIKVVAPQAVPALSPWMTVGLTAFLLASGWVLIRNHRRPRAAVGC